MERDECVFRFARRYRVPVVMLTSGGYQVSNAEVIARSILNLHEKGLIGPMLSTGFGQEIPT